MHEFFQEAIRSYNLPLTVIMGLVLIFWLLSLLGTIDIDTLDFDFDADVDADLDLDADVNTEVSTGGNILGTVLKAVNAQDVPIMMVVSLLTLFMWLIAIYGNYYLNPSHSFAVAAGLGVGNFIISTLMVKLVTQPMRPFFRAIKKDEEGPAPLIGSHGTVKSRIMDSHFGQVAIERDGSEPALLNAYLETGEALVRGQVVIILSYDDEKKRYRAKAAPELNSQS